jgi:uncharacterized RDD family membrane protein YckC
MRAVADAGKDALADEAERAIDGLLAGPLPELVGRSLVEHRVVARVTAAALDAAAEDGTAATPQIDADQVEELVRRLAGTPALERMIAGAIDSRLADELAARIVQSPAFRRMLTGVLTSPELRQALERQTAGFAGDVASAARSRARRTDDAVEARVHGWLRRPRAGPSRSPYAGVATRGTALLADTILVHLVFLVGGALIGLVASLFGTLRPVELVGALAGGGWLILVVAYFVGFWSTVGQTPGMRWMRVRVAAGSGTAPSGWRAFVRLVGLALAIIPMFAGFLPAVVDARRRALPDYLAGTTVLYDPWPTDPTGLDSDPA